MKITVCGAGRGGTTLAADFSLMGHDVTLYQHPDFAQSLEPIRAAGGLTITGNTISKKNGLATPKLSTDAAEAVKGSDVVFFCLAAFGHENMMTTVIPHMEDGQIGVVTTGYFSSLRFRDLIHKPGRKLYWVETELLPYLTDNTSPSEIGVMAVKSALDFLISLVGLIVLAIPMAILAIVIKLDDRGPVFFKQKRIGKDQKHFMMLKFRTMRTDTPKDTATHLLSDPQQYITKVGRFLRKTSLDELPQIFNILLGEMSIVGPRPALWNQDDLIAQRDLYGANDITPGLTGWAQVNGRDELEIDEKARYDGEYAAHVTFKMDVTCFVMTIVNVLKSRGVVEGGTGTLAPHYEARREEIEEKQLGKGKKAG